MDGDNKDLINAGRGYLATRSIINNVSYELHKYNEELEKIRLFYANYLTEEKIAEAVGNYMLSEDSENAFEFLNISLKNEIVHDCLNQKEFRIHLSENINLRRDKYRPFYTRIGHEMPPFLNEMTAEQLCHIMGVKLMSPEELAGYHNKRDKEISDKNFHETLGLIFRAVLIIGMIILAIVLSFSE